MDLNDLNQTQFDNLLDFILSTINLALSLAGLFAVIALVIAGFQYILSRGEGEKAEQAQRSIIYTLLGLVVVFISPFVIRFILGNVLGV